MEAGTEVRTIPGPVYAWRSWRLDKHGGLHSLAHDSRNPAPFVARCPYPKPPGWNEISGGLFESPIGHRGPVPDLACSCGIYCYTDPADWSTRTIRLFPLFHNFDGFIAHGLVSLEGRAIRHERGWRAQQIHLHWLYLESVRDHGLMGALFTQRPLQRLAGDATRRYTVPVDIAPRWSTLRRHEVVDRGFLERYRHQALQGTVPPLETVNLHRIAELYL